MQKNNLSFTSVPIHKVSLQKVTKRAENSYANAVFSKLDPLDSGDVVALEKIKNVWGHGSRLVTSIWESFTTEVAGQCQFNAIELKKNRSLDEKIVGLVKSIFLQDGDKKNLYLWSIITKPEFGNKNPNRTIKGVGECMLGEIFNSAKHSNANNVTFYSDNKGFFKKTFEDAEIKLVNGKNYTPRNGHFVINEKDFDKYINYCKEKYKINF